MMVSDRAGLAGDAAGAVPAEPGVPNPVLAKPAEPAKPGEPGVPNPGPSSRAVLAHRDLRVVLALRAVLAILGAIVFVVAAVGLGRAGIVDHRFPSFLPGGTGTVITAYSGPLLAAAIGAGTVAGLLLVSAVTDIWRRALMGTSLAGSHAGLGHGEAR